MARYDDEYDWHGECDRRAARRALWTVLALLAALFLASFALLSY